MQPRGFIALISVMIISSVLLLIAAAGSLRGWYGADEVSYSEFKAQSEAAADACANRALLALAQTAAYAGGEVMNIDAATQCRVGAVAGGAQKTFAVQATSSQAVTNVLVTINISDMSVVSWQEVPTM